MKTILKDILDLFCSPSRQRLKYNTSVFQDVMFNQSEVFYGRTVLSFHTSGYKEVYFLEYNSV
jgi:hypothetical protein